MFGVVLFSILAVLPDISLTFVLDENANKLHDVKWQCDTICLGSGGRAQFDPEHKICKCIMDKNTDDIDIELMQKTAKNLGLNIITCNDYMELQKREINQKEENKEHIVDIEDRVGESPFPMFAKFDRRPFPHKTTPPFKNSVVAPSKKMHPFVKKIEKLRNNKDNDYHNLTARMRKVLKEQKERLDRLWEENEAKLLKSRSNFKESHSQKLLDVAKTKHKELLDKYLSRREQILSRSSFNNNRNNQDLASKQVTTTEDPEISPAESTGKSYGTGIILQPPGTYNNITE